MARPTTDTVKYFPHSCTHGKTMFIIEENYGNDGYAFWFKLLELLGDSEGHVFNYSNEANAEFLQAKTKFLGVKCTEILDKLAKLEAIDKELWFNHKLIWSDNFVKGISDAYKNRKRPIPLKPSFSSNLVSTSKTDISIGNNGVEITNINDSTPSNPQTKLNKIKLNNNKNIYNNAREETQPVDNFSYVSDELYPSGNAAEETAATLDDDNDQSLESSGGDFMSFWNAYPKRSGMPKAMEAWRTLTGKGIKPQYLIRAANKYALRMIADKTETKFIKKPHNFLLEGMYYEYLPKNLPDCPRCHGAGNYEVEEDDGMRVSICDCRKVLFAKIMAAV